MSLGQYRAAGIVLTDAQVAKPQMDAAGNIKVASGGTGVTSDQVQGNVASGATDLGNPVKVGGRNNTTLPTLTDGQRGDLQVDTRGGLFTVIKGAGGTLSAGIVTPADGIAASSGLSVTAFVEGFNGTTSDRLRADANGLAVQPALSANFWNYAAATGGIVNSTTAVTIKTAAGAGVRNYIKSLQLTADTLGAATEFAIRDGAAGPVLARIKINTAGLTASGTTIFDPPLRGSANTLVEIVTLSATVTGGVFANIQGYTGI